jgi:hypothetical protein
VEDTRRRAGYFSAMSQGLTIGAADEIAGFFGGIGAALDPDRTFEEGFEQTRGDMLGDLEYIRQVDPTGAAVAELFGGAPLMLIPGAAAARGASFGTQIGRGAAAGAVAGGAYGFNTEESMDPRQRLMAVPDAALLGSVAGAAAPVVGRAVGAVARTVTGRSGVPPIRTSDEIRTAAQQRYARSTANDLPGTARTVVDGNRFTDIAIDMADFYDRRLGNLPDPGLYPQALNARDWMIDAAARGDFSLGQLDTIRQTLGSFRQRSFRDSGASADMAMVDEMIEEYDSWLASLGPNDVRSGDIQGAVAELTAARAEWSAFRKTQEIERLLVNAETTAAARYTGNAGFETAVRAQFAALSKNPRRMAAFTPEEREAIMLVTRGGPVQNGLRKLGAFAPRGFFSTGAALYGLANTDPLMIALSAFGEVGRRGADALGRRNVNNLLSLVSNPNAQGPLIPPMQRGGVALATSGSLAALPQVEPPQIAEPWLRQVTGLIPASPTPVRP